MTPFRQCQCQCQLINLAKSRRLFSYCLYAATAVGAIFNEWNQSGLDNMKLFIGHVCVGVCLVQ